MTTQQPPSRIFGGGDYQEIKLLGQGGFAQVYLVEDNLGRPWALKQIKEDLIKQDPNILERFEREAQIQAGLKHPHIAGVHTFNPKEGYLVIDFIEGRTLRRLIDDDFPEGMDFDTALNILQPIEEALTYIHEHAGFAHLDITPRNILIQETRTRRGGTEQHVVLADFGLARVIDSDGWANLTIRAGAPGYWAPEQRDLTKDKPGRRSDIYSLGVVIGVMLTGRSPEEVLDLLHGTNNTLPSAFPPEVKRVLQRATEEDPKKRYATVKGLMTVFRQAVRSFYQGRTQLALSDGGRRWETSSGRPLLEQAPSIKSGLPAVLLPKSIVAPRPKIHLLSVVAVIILGALLFVGITIWSHPARNEPAPLKKLGGLPNLGSYCQSLHYPDFIPANQGNPPDLYCVSSIADDTWTFICKWQYGMKDLTAQPADPTKPTDPYGMRCFDSKKNDQGGLDLGSYCNALYSTSSTANLAGTMVNNWRCQQKIDLIAACGKQYPDKTNLQARFEGGSYYCYGL